MTQIVLFLVSPITSIVLFIGTIATQLMAVSAAQKGRLDRARKLGTLTFMGATLIVVREITLMVLFQNSMSIVMILLWSWIAWRDYKFLKSLPQK